MSFSILVEGDGKEESSDFYQVPRSFKVPEEEDATKSTTKELEWIALFAEFTDKRVYLETWLNPEHWLKITEF